MKIVIIDDDVLVCNALRTIISAADITILGIGHNHKDALSLFLSEKPDIILMDIRMGEKTGIDAASDILSHDKEAKILFLTTFADDEYLIQALKMGCKGYILKQDFENIIPALQAVYHGQTVFGKDIITKIPKLLHCPSQNLSQFPLDEKDLELITLVAKGLSNKEIAEKLYLSEGTIRNYLSTIMEKLSLNSRTKLVAFYYTNLK